MNPEPVAVTIPSSGSGSWQADLTYEIEIENIPNGTLKIYKTSNMDCVGPDRVALPGAQFELYRAVSEDAAADCSNQENLIGLRTTDENGLAAWENLEAGGYWLKEIRADGHAIPNSPVKVEVSPGENVEGYGIADIEQIDNNADKGKAVSYTHLLPFSLATVRIRENCAGLDWVNTSLLRRFLARIW